MKRVIILFIQILIVIETSMCQCTHNGFALYNMAKSHHKSGVNDKALLEINKYIQLNKNCDSAYYYKASIIRVLSMTTDGKYKIDEALFAINRAIEINPDFSIAYSFRARLYIDYYCVYEETYDKAWLDISKAISLDSGNIEAIRLRTIVRPMYKYTTVDDFICQLDDLNKVIKIWNFPDCIYERGLVKLKLNDTIGGCQDIRLAKSMGYSFKFNDPKECK